MPINATGKDRTVWLTTDPPARGATALPHRLLWARPQAQLQCWRNPGQVSASCRPHLALLSVLAVNLYPAHSLIRVESQVSTTLHVAVRAWWALERLSGRDYADPGNGSCGRGQLVQLSVLVSSSWGVLSGQGAPTPTRGLAERKHCGDKREVPHSQHKDSH